MSYDDDQHCANCCDKNGTQFIQLIPGGGWMAEYDQPDGSTYIQPIVAWALDANGFVRALDLSESVLEEVTAGPGVRIVHPKQHDRPKGAGE